MNQDDEQQPPVHKAVTLFYDGEQDPTVSAKGDRAVAEKIIEIARAHGIPMHQDAALTNLLSNLDLGESIPQSLYVAVAKVIAFAYMLNEKIPKKA